MLRRLATGTLAAALVSGGLVLFAGQASAAPCPTSSPAYGSGKVCGITVDKTSAPPGGSVTVAGTGFSKNCGVTIKLDGDTIGTGTSTGTGSFSQPVTIPAGTAPGTHSLTAADQCSTFVLGESFTVSPAATSGSALPFTGFVFWPIVGGGAALVLVGAGFVVAGRRRRLAGVAV